MNGIYRVLVGQPFHLILYIFLSFSRWIGLEQTFSFDRENKGPAPTDQCNVVWGRCLCGFIPFCARFVGQIAAIGKHLMLASMVLGWSSQCVVGIYSTGENITMIVFITPKMEYYTGQFPPKSRLADSVKYCVTYLGPHTQIYK